MRIAYAGVAILGVAFLIGAGGVARAQVSTNPQVWQGEAFVAGFPTPEAKTACEGYAAVGDFYRLIYRPIIAGSPENGVGNDEGLTFIGSRNALHYFTDNGVSFAWPGNGYEIYFGTHGQSSRQVDPPAAVPFYLKIAPEKITLRTRTVTIAGSLHNWEDHSGCNVEISSALTLRID